MEDEKLVGLKQDLQNVELLIPVLEMKDRFSGLERKVQLKATKWKPQKDDQPKKAALVLVVAKWGGELTVSGLSQSQELGRRLRHDLYPNDPTGLLRLHSSFRHDFKIYSSQEGRCQITAAAFTKGFLDLEGDIIPILVSLVTRDSFAQGLLDEPIPKKQRSAVKGKIESLLLSYEDMSSPDVLPNSCPTEHSGLREAVKRIGSPLQLLHTIRCLAMEYLESITAQKEKTYEEMKRHSAPSELEAAAMNDPHVDEQDEEEQEAHEDAVPLGHSVPLGPGPMIPFDLKDNCKRKWLHLRRKEHRWKKLLYGFLKLIDEEKSYTDDNVTYDTSKIPDVWDNLYYDMLTHRHYLGEDSCKIAEMMVGLLHPLSEWTCLSEYGISQDEKLRIGVEVTWRLLGKMLGDLEFMIEDDSGNLDEAGRRRTEKTGVRRTISGVRGPTLSDVRLPIGVSRPASSSGQELADLGDGLSPGMSAHRSGASNGNGPVTGGGMTRSGQPSPGPGSSAESVGDGMQSPTGSQSRPMGLNPWKEWATNSEGSDIASSMPNTPREPLSPSIVERDTCSAEKGDQKRRSKLSKLTSDVRNELKQALRDSSDWHPRLNDQVAKLTDIKNTRIVRSRIYCTSASTMHSLFNVLRHGQCASGEDPIVKDLDETIDLSYLTHLVFRCYERDIPAEQSSPSKSSSRKDSSGSEAQDDAKMREKARYRVEISMSPGVQVFKDGEHVKWPKGTDITEESCMVAPLQIVADSVELSGLEKFLTEAIKEYGAAGSNSTDEDEDKQSDQN